MSRETVRARVANVRAVQCKCLGRQDNACTAWVWWVVQAAGLGLGGFTGLSEACARKASGWERMWRKGGR